MPLGMDVTDWISKRVALGSGTVTVFTRPAGGSNDYLLRTGSPCTISP